MSNVLSGSVVAQHARAAGFTGEALVTAVAVAKAESGWNATAVGDTTLANAKWGPSIGLWQIRSLNEQQGSGKERDQIALFDPAFNARSAYAISGGGTNWQPWSVYTSGAYRKHLPAARAAAADPAVAAVTPGAPAGPGQPILGLQLGGPALPITIGGAQVAGTLGAALHRASVDFTVGKVSEMQIELTDPGYTLTERHRLQIGSIIDYLRLRWSTVEFESYQGPSDPHVILKAQPEGVVFLRNTIPSPATNLSATEWLFHYAALAKLQFIGEPSARRPSIAAETIEDPLSGVKRQERVWEVAERLAGEEGMYLFESAGTLYFAGGNYLNDRAQKVQLIHRGERWGPEYGPTFDLLGRPRCRATKRPTDPRNPANDTRAWATPNAGVFYDVSISGARVLRPDGERLRPGMSAVFSGVAPFFRGIPQMLTQVTWDLKSMEVAVSAGTLEQKQGTAPTPTATAATGTAARGTKSALDMVTFMLLQVGDRYVFGAETRLDDPDPSAFDCSELIQWACAQVGVNFVDGSANQIGASKRARLGLTVEQAARTRGALLYTPGHIAVSLGDGRSTIEARGSKYGVVQYVIGNRFREGGKIPGLIYPA